MANNPINLPGGFGGLTRYTEDYESIFNLSPFHIILFVILIIGLRIGLGVFYS